WSSAFDGKEPVKGLTHAREPIWFWSPFKSAVYGSEHPGQRWLPVSQPLVLHPRPQTSPSSAKNVCFIQEWPTCSKRSLLLGAPLTSCVISIGCIAAPTEIFPTATPASARRPSALANSFEIRSRPPWILSNCALASYP